MDGKIFARIGAVVFIAIALTVTAIEMSSKDDEPEALATRDRFIAPQDPLASELRRCSGIGEAGPRDPGCLKAWADSRRRFLGQRDSATAPAAVAPTTLFPNAAGSADRKEGERTDVTAPEMQVEPPRPEAR
ncbi:MULTISPECIES: putative entry exclusion protein TrbK-alt [unclassified Mesorhizobium]|uniref:putative entry exclusion protein TrbK-alt n=1 Tax=unclassified Mesorhizobium TaxID=325217 RepID=UPI0003CF5656|nr:MULTISPECIES: putative entry exclusion protein TrbK-alt [unclassified Mesorhizobium]ESX29190.1 conjugal transfer protein TrbK [Mesorhizobium sp. LSHC440B00]ESX37682.1 conjugal transfer protein TrbK [Mesorhizobium sp. LSHC432A00]ESX43003.1 conjugal transfer protein TrbK [Mesorhizobium sp. LSHC440A00]WJI57263.1 putative entry exclusion protein TrbK-alt [Mesorhizobium sp. C432A]